jgi:hypothetical protein
VHRNFVLLLFSNSSSPGAAVTKEEFGPYECPNRNRSYEPAKIEYAFASKFFAILRKKKRKEEKRREKKRKEEA